MSPLKYFYEYEFAAVFVCLVTIILLIHRRCLKNRRNIFFLLLVLSELFSASLDAAANIMINTIAQGGEVNMVALNWLNGIFLFTHNLMPIIFFIYSNALIRRFKKPWFYILTALPAVFGLSMLFINGATHWVFYFDAENNYQHGWAIWALYGSAFFYMFVTAVEAVVFRKNLPKGYAGLIILFIATAAGATVVQLIFKPWMVEIFVCSVVLFVMAVNFETEESRRDPTTRLYNLSSFLADAESIVGNRSPRELVIIKLADIHRLNVSYGVKSVNAALKEVGSFCLRMNNNFRIYDCGEGNIVIPMVASNQIDELMSALRAGFSKGFGVEHNQIRFDPLYIRLEVPTQVKTIQEIVLVLDAPYIAGGEKGVEVLERLKREAEIEAAIERAIENESVLVYYQPIYSCKLKRINSAEALCRIKDEKLGYLSPGEFIPVAEKNGQIGKLGLQIFRKVAQLQSRVDFKALGIEYIEVNLSSLQIIDPLLYPTIQEIIKRFNVPPSFINFEITESAFIENQQIAQGMMNRFINDGFVFSIDDFGTGYSNFTYLYDMPFHIVKIDKSILDSAMTSEVAQKTLNSMIRMLKDLSFKVLQEGVEDRKQTEMLSEFGIDYIQGFYYSEPIPAAEFVEYLKRENGPYLA